MSYPLPLPFFPVKIQGLVFQNLEFLYSGSGLRAKMGKVWGNLAAAWLRRKRKKDTRGEANEFTSLWDEPGDDWGGVDGGRQGLPDECVGCIYSALKSVRFEMNEQIYW